MDLTPLHTSRDFRSLFIGHSVSFLGDEIITVVVPYQVYKITGSILAVGMIGLVTLIPVSVFPIVGGAAADATERRRLIITTHVILAVLSLTMALNAARPTPSLWPLCAFSFLSAGLHTFNRPALDTWPALAPGGAVALLQRPRGRFRHGRDDDRAADRRRAPCHRRDRRGLRG
jgi:MFS family permease